MIIKFACKDHCLLTEDAARKIDFQCPECKELLQVRIQKPAKAGTSNFYTPNSKTLKLQIRLGMDLDSAIKESKWIISNSVGETNRVEFRYEDFYYVVAKLKS